MTSERISISSCEPGRPAKKTSTISSKLNSQNGSLRLPGQHMGAIAEAAAVFVVGIEHENPQVGTRVEDLMQDQRERARLADAGGAEHREMLAQHLVDVDVGADRAVLLQVADLDHGLAGQVEHQAELGFADRQDRVADRRIGRDAAPEMGGRRRRLAESRR